MAIREGAWDCPVCGRKGNRGPEKFCGGCGAPRGPEAQLYLPDDAPEVVEAEALKRAAAGPDWICPYCQGDNPAVNDFCSGCGAPRDGAKTRAVTVQPAGVTPASLATTPATPGGKSPWAKRLGLGCLGLIAIVGLFLFLGRPKATTLTATGFHWQRTVAVEQLRQVTEQAWEGEVPSGARVLSSSREVYHVDHLQTGTVTRHRTVSEQVKTGTKKVKTGTRNLGNGYFEDIFEDRPVYANRSHQESYQEPVYRDRPVYRQRIRYEIEKWTPDRDAKAEGSDHAAAWPDPRLSAKERGGKRTETYQVSFRTSKGASATYEAPNEQAWRSFEEGRSYKGKVDGDGKVVEVEGVGGK